MTPELVIGNLYSLQSTKESENIYSPGKPHITLYDRLDSFQSSAGSMRYGDLFVLLEVRHWDIKLALKPEKVVYLNILTTAGVKGWIRTFTDEFLVSQEGEQQSNAHSKSW